MFFVTGNHDVYSGGEPWVERVRELGMRVLRNERVAIGGAARLRPRRRGRSPRRLGARLERGPRRARSPAATRRARWCCSRTTRGSFRRASAQGVDLQLSGHTHGGQIWPFNYLVRLAVPWVAGLHRVGASLLYVSRGTGFWGPPMRLFAPAEITELVLRGTGEAPH